MLGILVQKSLSKMELSIGWMNSLSLLWFGSACFNLHIQSGSQKLEIFITCFFNYFGKIGMQQYLPLLAFLVVRKPFLSVKTLSRPVHWLHTDRDWSRKIIWVVAAYKSIFNPWNWGFGGCSETPKQGLVAPEANAGKI